MVNNMCVKDNSFEVTGCGFKMGGSLAGRLTIKSVDTPPSSLSTAHPQGSRDIITGVFDKCKFMC